MKRNRKLESSSLALVQRVLSGERLLSAVDIQEPKPLMWGATQVIKLPLSDVEQFNAGNSLETSSMAYAIALMRSRDTRIATAHKDVNSDKDNYTAYQLSAFLPPTFMPFVIKRQFAAAKGIFDEYCCGKKLNELFQMYVPWHLDEEQGGCSKKWTAFAVRLSLDLGDLQRQGLYFDPTCTGKQV